MRCPSSLPSPSSSLVYDETDDLIMREFLTYEHTMEESQIINNMDVHIKVKGQRLQEYFDESAEKIPKTIIKYVTVQPGEDFAIAYRFASGFYYKDFDLVGRVYIDGNYVSAVVLSAKDNYVEFPLGVIKSTTSCKNGQHFSQNFIFANLIINEEDEELDVDRQQSVNALGEIQFKFWRVHVTSECEKAEYGDSKELDEISEVSEKALKGRPISHHVKLGKARPCQGCKAVNTTSIDLAEEPFATHIIRYRSTEALKIMGLIPRTPEPVPLEEGPLEELSLEEMKELIRRQKGELKTKRDIKRESNSETAQSRWEPWFRSQWEDGDELSVTEVRPAKRAKIFNGPVDTADLTGE